MKGLSVKPKTQRNRAVLLTIFATLLRSEIHINIKIDADVPFFRLTICHIFQGHWTQYAGKCACVYDTCSV